MAANRSLEDLDEYYRNNPPLIVIGDKDAVCSNRPLRYTEREITHMQRVAGASQHIEVEEKVVGDYDTKHIE